MPKQSQTKKDVEVVTIYGARRWRDREEDGSPSLTGIRYYSKKEEATLISDDIIETKAVKVGTNFYDFCCDEVVLEGEIPLTTPSRLEKIAESVVALDMGNGKISVIYSTPMENEPPLR